MESTGTGASSSTNKTFRARCKRLTETKEQRSARLQTNCRNMRKKRETTAKVTRDNETDSSQPFCADPKASAVEKRAATNKRRRERYAAKKQLRTTEQSTQNINPVCTTIFFFN